MKKWIVILFAMLPSLAMAAGANVPLDKANVDLTDKASLQNGAKLFMNYCFACHSTQYQRYERVATDLEIPTDLMKENLIFNPEAKIGDLMVNAMPPKQAANWFVLHHQILRWLHEFVVLIGYTLTYALSMLIHLVHSA